MLYEKFGELNSAQEINELAENLFNENDIESLKELAKENGAGGRNATLRYKIEYHIPIHCQRNESWTGAMNMFLGICIACIIKNAGAGQISPAAAVEM